MIELLRGRGWIYAPLTLSSYEYSKSKECKKDVRGNVGPRKGETWEGGT